MVRERSSPEITKKIASETALKKLSPEERSVVLLAAQGNDRKRTGEILSRTEGSVRAVRKRIFDKLSVGSIEGAIMTALRSREITPEEVLPENYDINRLDQIKPDPQRVLDALTEEGRTNTSNVKIASELSLAEETVKTHMKTIIATLGVSGREQTAAIVLSLKLLEQKCLTSLASAMNQQDFTEILERKLYREIFTHLKKRFGTFGIFDTIFAGIKNKVIDADKLTEGFDKSKLSTVQDEDIGLLKRFIIDYGNDIRNTTIDDEDSVTSDAVATRLAMIGAQLGTDLHPAVLYYALKSKPPARRSIG